MNALEAHEEHLQRLEEQMARIEEKLDRLLAGAPVSWNTRVEEVKDDESTSEG